MRFSAHIYTLFAIAAGARSAVQLATKAEQTPLACGHSATTALTYLAATVLLRAPDMSAHLAHPRAWFRRWQPHERAGF